MIQLFTRILKYVSPLLMLPCLGRHARHHWRASRMARETSESFQDSSPRIADLQWIAAIPPADFSLQIWVAFETDGDLDRATQSGLTSRIERFVRRRAAASSIDLDQRTSVRFTSRESVRRSGGWYHILN